MSMLADLMTNTLDAGYLEAAARRDHRPRHAPGVGMLIGLLLIGLVLATAATQVRNRSVGANAERAALVAEVQRRTAGADRAAADLATLRIEIAQARRDALALAGDAGSAERLDRLELVAGGVPVRGPGLVVTVDDAQRSNPDEPVKPEDRILDRDLQNLVNGLWAAGAEAVAVNGQRLTALSAIRSADVAILVDYRPVLPPYVVRAIGDPRTLEPGFLDSQGGRELRLLADNYGFRFDVERSDRVELPAASALSLRLARPAVPARPEGTP